jgi:hypothetical protein
MAVHVRASCIATLDVFPKQRIQDDLALSRSQNSDDDDVDFGSLMKVDTLCFFSGGHLQPRVKLTL